MIYLTYKNFTWTTSVFFSYFVWRSICSYNHYIPDFSVNLQPRAKYLGKNKKQHSKNTFVDFIFVIFRFLCFFVCVCVCVFCFVCVFLLVYSEAAVEDFFKIDVNKNFTIFTRKHLCLSRFFDKVGDYRITTILKKRLQHSCFPLNIAKFSRTPFFTVHFRWLLLCIHRWHFPRKNRNIYSLQLYRAHPHLHR